MNGSTFSGIFFPIKYIVPKVIILKRTRSVVAP